jgi:hypothetical protein
MLRPTVSLSWNKAPIRGLGPDFYYCQTVAGLLMWGAVSDERTCLSFTIAAGPRQRYHSRVLSQIRNFPFCRLLHTGTFSSESESSYVTTDGQSASLSWNKACIWGLWPDFYYWGFLCGAHSLTRGRVCRLYFCRPSPAHSFSARSLVGLFYSLRIETPPTWRARSPYLCPPGTVFLFVASYD